MKLINIFNVSCLLLLAINGFSQDSTFSNQDVISSKSKKRTTFPNDTISGKRNIEWREFGDRRGVSFREMQSAFNKNWDGVKPKKGQGYKPFKRWEAFTAPRVFPSGDMTLPSTAYGNFESWLKENTSQPTSKARVSLNLTTTSTGNWTEIGPLSKPSGYDSGVGRVDMVRFDPSNPSIMYVCSPDGGLWKTIDGGANWTTNSDFLPIIGCADLVIDPTDPQTMYLATGNREYDRSSIGILKSKNGGSTWTLTAFVIPASDGWTIRRLIMDPSNPLNMIAVLNAGMAVTNDGWETVSYPTLTGSYDLQDVEFKPGDPNTVYAVGKDFYKSTNKGDTWTKITNGLPNSSDVSRALMAVSAANSAYVYLLYGNTDGGYLGTYRSTDGGDTFSERSSIASLSNNILNCDTLTTVPAGQATHNLALVVSPNDEDLVTIGGCNAWQSTDGGTSWALRSYWLGKDANHPGEGISSADYVHADIQSLEYLPGSNTTLFITSDGGISKSLNNGTNWTDISSNLRVAQMTNVGQSSLTPYNMITGLQDIGTLKNSNGSWYVTNGGDGEDGFIDHTNDDVLITSNPNGAFAISFDGGLSRYNITGLPAGTEFFSPIHQDPVDASLVYAGGREALYKSNGVLSDENASWTTLGVPVGNGGISRFEIAPSNNQIIYVLKADLFNTGSINISKSTDGGLNFTDVTVGLPVNLAAVSNLTISNTDADKVWVTFSGYDAGTKVYKTVDGGATWTNISSGLPNLPMNTIVYMKDSPLDAVYLGADIGVYYMDNNTPWTQFFTDLPRSHVNDLEIYYPTSKIRAATYGRGLWESDLYEVSNCIKPDAGIDQAPTCVGNTAITSTTLAATAVAGGSWSQVASNPAGAVIDDPSSENSEVTGLNPGTYGFIWATTSTCSDTVQVTILNCACVKPDAGIDQAPTCVGNTAITSTTLAATGVAGGSWSQVAGNPAGAIFTDANAANSEVTGLNPGTYGFIWSTTSTCSDTVQVTIPNCACVKPDAGIDQAPSCVGNTAITSTTLAATAVAGGSWSQVASNPAGAVIDDPSSENSAVTGLNPGTYGFIWSTTSTCSDTVQVTIPNCACVKPDAGIDQAPTCVGNTAITSTTLAATAVAGGSWSQVAGNPAGAIFTDANAANSEVTGLNPGTYGFIWSTTSTCSDTVQVTIPNCACVKPDAGIDQAPTCVGNTAITSTTLAATAVAGGSWSQVTNNPAGAIFTDANAANSEVTGLNPGVYNFIWATTSTCSDTVQVTIPNCECIKPDAGIDQAPSCVGNTAITSTTLAATAVAGGSWSQVASNPAGAVIGDPSSENSAVTGLNPGTYGFIWSTTSTCSDTVQVTIPNCACIKPDAGVDQAPTCVGNTAITSTTLAATAVAGGSWSQVASNPTGAIFTDANAANSEVTGLNPGVYNFIWATTSTCSDTVQVTIPNCACVKPNAGVDQAPTCVGNTAITSTILAATAVAGGSWSQVAGNPAGAIFTDANAANSEVTGLNPGVYNFIWATTSTCSDTVQVTIPNCACVKPDAGVDQAPTCVGNTAITSTTLAATAVAGGSWSQVASNPAGAVIDDPSSESSAVTGLNPGVYNFIWATTSTCSDTVQVTIPNCECIKPDAGVDQAPSCVGNTAITSTTLAATAVAGGSWSQVASNPAGAVIDDPSSESSAVTGLNPGVYNFIWATTSTCSDTVQVTIPNCACVKPDAGVDQAPTCVGNTAITSTTLAAMAVAGGSWSQVAGNPAGAIFTDANAANSVVTGLTPGTYGFIWATTSTCSDTVQVTIPNCACVKPDAGIDQAPTCVGNTAITSTTLAATAVAGGSWSQVASNPAGAVIDDPSSESSAVTGLNPGVYNFIWATTSTCSDTVQVTIPNCECIKPDAGVDQAPTCVGNTAITSTTLAATAVAGGSWSQVAGSPAGAVFTDANAANSEVTGLNPGVYNFIWSTTSTCSDTVQVTIPNCPILIDLVLTKSVDKKVVQIGEELVYTLKLYNRSNVAGTGIEISDSLGSSIQFVPGSIVSSRGNASFSNNVLSWMVPDIAANAGFNGDTVTLSYKIKATAGGIHFNRAAIIKVKVNGNDVSPNQGNTNEDISSHCFTVPLKLCSGQVVEVSVPSTYTSVQWYKNGGTTPVANGNTVQFGDVGTYTFTSANNDCPTGGCCPVVIELVDCCPNDICIPLIFERIKR